jgi:hypothetical protein
MNSQVCKCCGQPVAETKDVLARNPNICVKCSEAEEGKGESSPADIVLAVAAEHPEKNASGMSAFAM